MSKITDTPIHNQAYVSRDEIQELIGNQRRNWTKIDELLEGARRVEHGLITRYPVAHPHVQSALLTKGAPYSDPTRIATIDDVAAQFHGAFDVDDVRALFAKAKVEPMPGTTVSGMQIYHLSPVTDALHGAGLVVNADEIARATGMTVREAITAMHGAAARYAGRGEGGRTLYTTDSVIGVLKLRDIDTSVLEAARMNGTKVPDVVIRPEPVVEVVEAPVHTRPAVLSLDEIGVELDTSDDSLQEDPQTKRRGILKPLPAAEAVNAFGTERYVVEPENAIRPHSGTYVADGHVAAAAKTGPQDFAEHARLTWSHTIARPRTAAAIFAPLAVGTVSYLATKDTAPAMTGTITLAASAATAAGAQVALRGAPSSVRVAAGVIGGFVTATALSMLLTSLTVSSGEDAA